MLSWKKIVDIYARLRIEIAENKPTVEKNVIFVSAYLFFDVRP